MTMPCRLDATQGSEVDSTIPESLAVSVSRYQHAWPDAGILDQQYLITLVLMKTSLGFNPGAYGKSGLKVLPSFVPMEIR